MAYTSPPQICPINFPANGGYLCPGAAQGEQERLFFPLYLFFFSFGFSKRLLTGLRERWDAPLERAGGAQDQLLTPCRHSTNKAAARSASPQQRFLIGKSLPKRIDVSARPARTYPPPAVTAGRPLYRRGMGFVLGDRPAAAGGYTLPRYAGAGPPPPLVFTFWAAKPQNGCRPCSTRLFGVASLQLHEIGKENQAHRGAVHGLCCSSPVPEITIIFFPPPPSFPFPPPKLRSPARSVLREALCLQPKILAKDPCVCVRGGNQTVDQIRQIPRAWFTRPE